MEDYLQKGEDYKQLKRSQKMQRTFSKEFKFKVAMEAIRGDLTNFLVTKFITIFHHSFRIFLSPYCLP